MTTQITHKKKVKASLLVILTYVLLFSACQYSQNPAQNVKLNSMFTDNMVLQRNQDIPIWGTAEPGGKIVVSLNENQKKGKVDEDGKWRIDLDPVEAGGPYQLSVMSQDTIVFENVMVGEVWICSGQSNMEMALLLGWSEILNAHQEIADANYPDIRIITVEKITSTTPLDTTVISKWEECSPETIPEFSAVAYFFGRHVHKSLNIPVGLINTSWGGTIAEAWTSAGALKTMPDFADEVEIIEIDTTGYSEAMKKYEAEMEVREKTLLEYDDGFKKGNYVWNSPDMDLSDWELMSLPTLWEKAGHENLDGVVWFRKAIDIPASMNAKDLTLKLGPINDDDITWFNGQQIGKTNGIGSSREYKIPESLIKTGTNYIAVRVFDMGNNGGFFGKPEQMRIEDNAGEMILLSGDWNYKIGLDMGPMAQRPKSPDDPNRPTVLYNAMINPLIPYGIKGAIWYQGESNADRAFQYRTLFPTMIQDWRTQWDIGDFPFLFVQLANFMEVNDEPQEAAWAELREAQLMTLSLPNTGMAVIIDIGNALDIHPKNKQDVGKRLALNALHIAYDQDIAYSGPIYKEMSNEESKIRLTFNHANEGLTTRDDEALTGFAIAGEDKVFHWAKAEIDGETVVVSCEKVPNPVSVRYAWDTNPICNLYNNAGLPASPFRTDSWPGITVDNK
ncbi:MAG: beta galactosidase jelly roll domain-containing protein [Bacteroidales bacterium]|nr:beta galactosidase jelly roll domain-containing protein [Bacteroidales bacterium]